MSELPFLIQEFLSFALSVSYIFLGAFLYFGSTPKQRWWAYGVIGASLIGIKVTGYLMTDMVNFFNSLASPSLPEIHDELHRQNVSPSLPELHNALHERMERSK